MISPSIGRVVWFTPAVGDKSYPESKQPCAALVTYVHSDTMVNLAVFDSNGRHHSETSVTLVQDDAGRGANGRYAEWMPFQKGQAAKTEALEAKLA